MNNINSRSGSSLDHYVAAFLTGLALVVAAPTVERLRDTHYIVPPPKDDQKSVLTRTIPAYTAGEVIGSIAFPLLVIYGVDQMISSDKPQFIEAMMGTLLLANVISSLYEYFRGSVDE